MRLTRRHLEAIVLGVVLTSIVALRAARLDEPIVENYVGRQIPTAMVARNLGRGSGFLRPQLDTGPPPNLFLVEPPIYALLAVGLRRVSGLPLEQAGRLVSALATALAAWGLFGLARRREGPTTAIFAVVAFAALPVTIRYGRAFQPDAAMLGLTLAGLRLVDDGAGSRRGDGALRACGCALVATGLAVKITAIYVLVPLWMLLGPSPTRRVRAGTLAVAVAPALMWYAYAVIMIASGVGSRASADNGASWLRALGPLALLDRGVLLAAARGLLVRSFTPVGVVLALYGLRPGAAADGFWRLWGLAALVVLLCLGAKLHHDYYWLALAPVVSVGVACGTIELARSSRLKRAVAALAFATFLMLGAAQSRSTFVVPASWSGLRAAAESVRAHVPVEDWVVAPEALLFAADRRGCRLEVDSAASSRAAGEWRGVTLLERSTIIDIADVRTPLALVAFYRERGARFFADLTGDDAHDAARLGLHEAIRRRYKVLVDGPAALIADLDHEAP